MTTVDGSFDLVVRERVGDRAVLEAQPRGPHRLYVAPAVLADPAQLARVLHAAVDAHVTGHIGADVVLVLQDPDPKVLEGDL
ncbi:hypothetical protein [Phytohabitans rumicis]|uniref:hypothetical protein n=1 Tax=Phytohabitans rumicis TaxID=1076125 RepID=UPI001564D559|nr:hypothetical protein [Phytohabitans rumicis]